MTRIIAGVAGGRRLAVPAGTDTRPTSDRAREGVFSTVSALLGPLAGARVLDLYAGSGALGLEALSRGAAEATFVECAAPALHVLRRNIAALGLPGATVRAESVERWVHGFATVADGTDVVPVGVPCQYDLVLADPPYPMAADRVAEVLVALTARGLAAADALAVVERARRDPVFRWPPGWIPVRGRRYGEAMLWYGRAA